MLTTEERKFVEYWKQNRAKQKRIVNQFMIGLPLGVLFAILIFINLFSGWYKRADMMIHADPSLILVILIAIILIVIFIAIFSVRHRWEMNEQRYLELISKDHKPFQQEISDSNGI